MAKKIPYFIDSETAPKLLQMKVLETKILDNLHE